MDSLRHHHYLTVHELSVQLRLSEATIYRLIRTGEVRALRVGGQFRIPSDVIEDLSTATRVPA